MRMNKKGVSMTGYAILVGLIALMSISSVLIFGEKTASLYERVSLFIKDNPKDEGPNPTPLPPKEEPLPDVEPEEPKDYPFFKIDPVGAAYNQRGHGGRSNQGTISHIGGGLFMSHNHGRLPSNPTLVNNAIIAPLMSSQQNIQLVGFLDFDPGADSRVWNAPAGYESVPALPLLVAYNPADLIGRQGLMVGWPFGAKPRDGTLWGSGGKVIAASNGTVTVNAPLSGGFSGSLIQIQSVFPGVGAGIWGVGTMATASGRLSEELRPDDFPPEPPIYANGNATNMNPTRYAKLVLATKESFPNMKTQDIAPVLLLGAQKSTGSKMTIKGTHWPEVIVSSIDGGRIETGGGKDTIHITKSSGPNGILTIEGEVDVHGFRHDKDWLILPQGLENVSDIASDDGRIISYQWQGQESTIVLKGVRQSIMMVADAS